VYTLVSNEVNEVNEIKPNRYLIASNDAVKSVSLATDIVEENYEVNTPDPLTPLHAPDCYPPPCPHVETVAEPMPDGSQLVRCVVCKRPVATSPKERS
jgi:hypothetical protein